MPPVNLIPRSARLKQAQKARARENTPIQTLAVRSPWHLLLPDVDPHKVPASGADSITGLVARPDPGGRGEVLTAGPGFSPIDETRMPGDNMSKHASTDKTIVMIAQLNRTDSTGDQPTGTEWNKTLIVATAGNGTTAGSCEFWRVVPSTGQWEEIAHSGITGSTAAAGGRDNMFDWCTFGSPAAAADRTDISNGIAEPAIIFTNGVDQVYVYPVEATASMGDTEDGDYEALSDTSAEWAGAPADPFAAVTCESFAGRVYYGNTTEGGTQYRQRIRRSGLFTADPNPSGTGAGSRDVSDFSGDLLRMEKLGDLLACYFEDGVAFLHKTDVGSAPDRIDILRDQRGLLSTHALTAVADDLHFGVFDDGWWFLDPSGRWQEAGILNVDGFPQNKWKQAFYGDLDIDNKQRIVAQWDGEYVRISRPVINQTENTEVWVYDPKRDRVTVENYEATMFGVADQQVATAVAWSATTDTWSSIVGSWSSFGAKFGSNAFIHGNGVGHVLLHDNDLITRYNSTTQTQVMPTYSYTSPLSSVGTPRYVKVGDRLWVEIIQADASGSTATMTMALVCNASQTSESGVVTISGGTNGDIQLPSRTFRFSSPNMAFRVSGTHPVLIRSFEVDFFDDRGEIRTAS